MVATTFDHRCRTRRRRASAVMAALVAFVPLACGHPKDASLCTAFGEFLDTRAQVASIELANLRATTAGEATDKVEDYLAGVRRLEQAADGRYGTELDTLETAVNDVLFTLDSVQDDADFSTWAPLVADDLELAEDAAVQATGAIAPSCVSESTETSNT